jgi:cytoskeletal protein CcmA (bactofilin family)
MVFPKTKDEGSYPQQNAGKGLPLKASDSVVRLQAFLGNGARVTGTFHFSGSVELDCLIEGRVISDERIFVGPSAVIRGNIEALEVIVRGTVIGDISARGRIVLLSGARVEGDLTCAQLSVEPGVLFRGSSRMEAVEHAGDAGARRLELARAGESKHS